MNHTYVTNCPFLTLASNINNNRNIYLDVQNPLSVPKLLWYYMVFHLDMINASHKFLSQYTFTTKMFHGCFLQYKQYPIIIPKHHLPSTKQHQQQQQQQNKLLKHFEPISINQRKAIYQEQERFNSTLINLLHIHKSI